MTAAMTMSSGIMTMLAFSMPLLTPRATMRYVKAMNTSMQATLSGALPMKPVNIPPPSANASAPPNA